MFTAWISDSRVRLKAIFASSAATYHQKKTGKRLTEETVGNIIQLENAEIVATHIHGVPRTSRITLRIKKFRLIGSDTSGQIGDPRPFEVTHEFDELLQKLSIFRRINGSSSRTHSVLGSPRKGDSRLANFTSDKPGHYGSQQLFSQVPLQLPLSDAVRISGKEPLSGLHVAKNSVTSASNKSTDKLLAMMKANNAPKTRGEAPTTEAEPAITKALHPPISSAIVEQKASSIGTEAIAHPHSQLEGAKSVTAAGPPKSEVKEANSSKVKSKRIRTRDIRIAKEQQEYLDMEDSWLPAKTGRRGPVAHIPSALLSAWCQHADAAAAAAAEKSLSKEVAPSTKAPQEDIAETLLEAEPDQTTGSQPDFLIPSQEWPSSSPIYEPRRELPPDSSPPVVDYMNVDSDESVQRISNSSMNNAVHGSDVEPSPKESDASSSMNEYHREKLATRTRTAGEEIGGSSSHVPSDQLIVGTSTNEPDSRAQEDNAAADLSDSGSDLETSMLLKLGEQAESANEPLFTQEVPATAIQPQDVPFLQVKRTPYGVRAEGGLSPEYIDSYSGPDRFSSPSKRRRIDDSGTAYSIEVNGNDAQRADLQVLTRVSRRSSQSQSPRVNETVIAQTTATQLQSSCVDENVFAKRTNQPEALPMHQPSVNELPLTRLPGSVAGKAPDRIEELSPSIRHAVLSPYVSKRRKGQRSPINFGFSQEEYPKEDPSITARRDREKFMARRKTSYPESCLAPHQSGQRISTPKGNEDRPSTLDVLQAAFSPSATPQIHGTSDIMGTGNPQYQEKAVNPMEIPSVNQLVKPSVLIDENEPASSPRLVSLHGPLSPRPVAASIEPSEPLHQNQRLPPDLDIASAKLEKICSEEISQQTNISGQAQSVPELMTPALSHSGLPQSAPPSGGVATTLQEYSPESAVYLRFTSVYPEYQGSKKHFVGMCGKIAKLQRADRMEHKSLWDDFIVRHKTDYPPYLQRCLEHAEDAKSYERFYRDEVDEPVYNKRVMQPNTLSEVVAVGSHPNIFEGYASTTANRTASPLKRLSKRRSSPSIHNRSSSPLLGATDETHEKAAAISFYASTHRVPEYDDRRRPREDQAKRIAKKGKPTNQPDVLASAETVDLTSILSSSPTSTPLAPQSGPSPERFTPRKARRLPWKTDAPTGPKEISKPNKPSGQKPPTQQSDRLSAVGNQGKKDAACTAKSSGVSSSTAKVQRSEIEAPQFLQPTKSQDRRRASIRVAPIATEESTVSRSNELELPQEDVDLADERRKKDKTSLKKYVVSYQAIRPGQHNAWAQEARKVDGNG